MQISVAYQIKYLRYLSSYS